jgi:hypothetical protein
MQAKSRGRVSAVVTVLSFIVMVGLNGLANALPLNGVTTGVLSDEIPNLFVPAGLTFAVWGLIYALLLGYAAAVLSASFGKEASPRWAAADGWIFSLNAILNAAWIVAWHWRMVGLSLAIMLGVLVTLIVLMERIYRADMIKPLIASNGLKASRIGGSELREFFLRVPILVYLGWICVATIANVTAFLVTAGWDGFGLSPSAWTVAMIAAGALVGLLLILRRGAVSSALVVVWAYVGIVLKRTSTDPEATMAIIVAAAIAAGLVALVALGYGLRSKRRGV